MRDYTSLPHRQMPYGRLWNKINGNFDNTRSPIDRIVIHSTAGTEAGSAAWFNNPASQVGIHYMITTSGEILSFVPETATAYHSGLYSMNQRSVGIEFVDNGNINFVRPDAMYTAGSRLIADIAAAHNIPLDPEAVKKHRDIVRTACPGTLDFDRLLNGARSPVTTDDEPLVSHMLKPSVFKNVVTKSTNYDDLWAYLALPDGVKGQAGSWQMIAEVFERKVVEAKGSVISAPVEAPRETPLPDGLSLQSKSVWKKDVSEMLGSILKILKGAKSNG